MIRIIAALMLLLATPAKADYYTIHGVGNQTCNKFVVAWQNQNIDPTTYWHLNGWLEGYVSSVNKSASDDKLYTGVDIKLGPYTNITGTYSMNDVNAWVRNWCVQHPLDKFADAANAVVFELIKR